MSTALPFIPGRAIPAELLTRYLPPIPAGVAEAWLRAHLPRGTWVLDPFGAAPHVAVEAARAGYRVLVAAGNPILRFLLELAACPPSEGDLRAALAELAASRKGEERLEPHLRSLYQTACGNCNQPVSAQAFLWERGAPAPYARLYQCPSCGELGERPATPTDIALAESYAETGLHRARALERIAPPGDPDRANAEEALSVYQPRAIYALITLINRLEGLLATPSTPGTDPAVRRRCLIALVLSALDQANSLWSIHPGRARPKQLSLSTRFRENNVWLAMEEAVQTLAGKAQPVTLASWPDGPAGEAGLVIFEGRIKDLSATLLAAPPAAPIQAALAALPRPNQAFWTLSALWAGWLWGREAIGPFKSALHRRRYDWGWHTTALHTAFSAVYPQLPPGAPFFGLIGEAEPGFLSASLIGADLAGFQLKGLALRAEDGPAQFTWVKSAEITEVRRPYQVETFKGQAIETAVQAAVNHLKASGEPAHYLGLHTAALLPLMEKSGLPSGEASPPGDTYSLLHQAFEEAFTPRHGFARFGGSEKSLEAGHWWHTDAGQGSASLADRTEMAVARYLLAHPGSTLLEIDRTVCSALPGLLTPGSELVSTCLASYGQEDPPGSGRWRLRQAESPPTRRGDLAAMRQNLGQLATRLGYRLQGDRPLAFADQGSQAILIFYLLASAVFGEIVFSEQSPAEKCLIVLPGARASLVVFKLRRDPRLRQAVEAGWRFLKFRHLRHLVESPSLTRESLDELLLLDPLTESPAQMRLL